MSEPMGTFTCPWCGVDHPHRHDAAVLNAARQSDKTAAEVVAMLERLQVEGLSPLAPGYLATLRLAVDGIPLRAATVPPPADVTERGHSANVTERGHAAGQTAADERLKTAEWMARTINKNESETFRASKGAVRDRMHTAMDELQAAIGDKISRLRAAAAQPPADEPDNGPITEEELDAAWVGFGPLRPPAAQPDAEQLAEKFHEAYERLAPMFGYETRKASAKPWREVPHPNRGLMIAVAGEVRSWLASRAAAAQPRMPSPGDEMDALFDRQSAAQPRRNSCAECNDDGDPCKACGAAAQPPAERGWNPHGYDPMRAPAAQPGERERHIEVALSAVLQMSVAGSNEVLRSVAEEALRAAALPGAQQEERK